MKNNKITLIGLMILFVFFTASIFISSCSDSTSPESSQGSLKLNMVDSPSGYDEVNIVVTRVEVHKTDADSNGGWFVINNETKTYDLLTLINGASAVLGDTNLDAGHYSQIRLLIGNGSNVVVNGFTHTLEIPSGEQSGLKLNHAFQIQPNVLYELILDFDASRSIILTGNGQYKLKPVIRVIPVITSGSISGVINPLITAGYIHAINGTDTVTTIANPLTGAFKVMALFPHSYRVEVLSANEDYNNTTIANVMVSAMQNTDLGSITLSHK